MAIKYLENNKTIISSLLIIYQFDFLIRNITTDNMILPIMALKSNRSAGCQLDEPYGFPGDHQPDATLL